MEVKRDPALRTPEQAKLEPVAEAIGAEELKVLGKEALRDLNIELMAVMKTADVRQVFGKYSSDLKKLAEYYANPKSPMQDLEKAGKYKDLSEEIDATLGRS